MDKDTEKDMEDSCCCCLVLDILDLWEMNKES